MIFLPTTSDALQLITSATPGGSGVNCHVSYADLTAGTVSGGRTNTRVTTAATTTICGSPAASTTRNIKAVKISNDGTVSQTATVQLIDGTNTIIIDTPTLGPGERFGYEEGVGWRVYDSSGREKVTTSGLPFGNANTADVVANAAATFLTGASLQIGGRVQAGSFFKWRLRVTKTAAGVATPTIAVTVGPNASTADTARVTHSSTAIQTAVADTGMFEVDATFRQVGATSIIESSIRLDHVSADAAGFGTFRYLSANSASFALGATDYIGLVCNPGASGVWTFQHVLIDAGNMLS